MSCVVSGFCGTLTELPGGCSSPEADAGSQSTRQLSTLVGKVSDYVIAQVLETQKNKQLRASKKSRAVASSVLAGQVQAAPREAEVGHVETLPLWAHGVGTSHALKFAGGLVMCSKCGFLASSFRASSSQLCK